MFSRRRDLDVARESIVASLIFFHTARLFDDLGFYVKNEPQEPAVTFIVILAAFWGMPLMFSIAGFAIWHSLEKRTAVAFVRERLKRLLIPFVFSLLVLVPPQVYYHSSYSRYGSFNDNSFESQYSAHLLSCSTFRLPNGSEYSPDVAVVQLKRWQALSPEQQQGILPLCPDFVIEFCPSNDQIKSLQDRMREYLRNGLRLGWLINLQAANVEIYRYSRPNKVFPMPAKVVPMPTKLSCEKVFSKDFTLYFDVSGCQWVT